DSHSYFRAGRVTDLFRNEWALAERLSHRCSGRIQRLGLNVAINVDRRCDGRVAKDATDDMHRNVVLEHDRAGRAAHVMKSDARQLLPLEERPELARDVRRIEWRADLRREDQVRLLPDGEDAELFLALPALVLQECLNDRRRQAEGSP